MNFEKFQNIVGFFFFKGFFGGRGQEVRDQNQPFTSRVESIKSLGSQLVMTFL